MPKANVHYRLETKSALSPGEVFVKTLAFESKSADTVGDNKTGGVYEGDVKQVTYDNPIQITLDVRGPTGSSWELTVTLTRLKRGRDDDGKTIWIETKTECKVTPTPIKGLIETGSAHYEAESYYIVCA